MISGQSYYSDMFSAKDTHVGAARIRKGHEDDGISGKTDEKGISKSEVPGRPVIDSILAMLKVV